MTEFYNIFRLDLIDVRTYGPVRTSVMNEFWDRVGISASLMCVLHCLLTPFLLILAPFVGEFLSEDWVHVLIAAIVFPVAIFALWRGFRIHKNKFSLILGGIGLILVALGLNHQFNHLRYSQWVLMIFGGLFLASAHYLNIKSCRQIATRR